MPLRHLAQINVGRLRAPIDDPLIAPFADALDEINALADRAPGFVWRLQTDEGNATSIQVDDDELVIVNMSVWESAEALNDYVYRTDHTAFLRRRAEWFERSEGPTTALWWVDADHRPSPQEGMARLRTLRDKGPTAEAFGFRTRFDADGSPADR